MDIGPFQSTTHPPNTEKRKDESERLTFWSRAEAHDSKGSVFDTQAASSLQL